jgi:ribosomal protein L32
MAKKVSKNSNVAKRAAMAGSGKDFVKIIKSVKDPVTGRYTFKETVCHKDKADAVLAGK